MVPVTPRKMKFLSVMADHTGDKVRKGANELGQTPASRRDWPAKAPVKGKTSRGKIGDPTKQTGAKKKVSWGEGKGSPS